MDTGIRTWKEWEEGYPSLKLIVHNQCAEVKDYFGNYPKDQVLLKLDVPLERQTETPGELWFDTVYIPWGLLTLGDLTNGYADERGFEKIEGQIYFKLWYD